MQTLDLSLIIAEAVFIFGMTISHSINWFIIHNDNSENTFFTFIIMKIIKAQEGFQHFIFCFTA